MPRRRLAAFAAAVAAAGCGTTRMTDTPRAASEMLLVSQAVDAAVGRLDFSLLAGQPVFLDAQFLDGTVDKGYVVSSLRQQLLAHGALVQEERKSARFVVEARSGAVGTDKNSLLVGTPEVSLPAVVPGMPTQIPEIALIKRTDQRGVAKLAVYAYDRHTGRALWQSGVVEADSKLQDKWVFGAGPFRSGTVQERTEFAGEPLPTLPVPSLPAGLLPGSTAAADPPPAAPAAVLIDPTRPAVWSAAPPQNPSGPPIPPSAPVVVPAGVVGR